MNVNKGEDEKSIFEKIVTYKNKTSIGIIGVVFGLLFFLMFYRLINVGGCIELCIIIVLLSAILLCTTETIKNNKVIGSVFLALNVFATFILTMTFNSFVYEGYTTTFVIISIYVAYGYICSLAYFVKSPKCDEVVINNNEAMYCSYCGKRLESGSKFCSNCGKDI